MCEVMRAHRTIKQEGYHTDVPVWNFFTDVPILQYGSHFRDLRN